MILEGEIYSYALATGSMKLNSKGMRIKNRTNIICLLLLFAIEHTGVHRKCILGI